jgi:mRNA-degrading endonuclease YafQ of YafQ-DinJ toxin-antitoxin module
MYYLNFSDDFKKQFKKLVKGNSVLHKQFEKALSNLKIDPFYPSLKSHKVDTKKNKNVWSSWVSGDIRVVWAFDENDNLVILVLEKSSHSDSDQICGK